MTIYEKNIHTLAKYYPGMDHNIEKARKELKEELDLIEELSADGEPILKIKKDGHYLYLAGKRCARKPPEEWMQEQGELCENYTFIIMGMGNIGYLRELIECVDVRLNIIIYEPSAQIFLKALEWLDLEKGMDKHLIIFWVENIGMMTLDKMNDVLKSAMKLEHLKHVQLFIEPNYDILFADKCEQLIKKCNDTALDSRMAYNTAKLFANIDSINTMKNAKYLCDAYKTIQLYETIPFDVTGIVVAAGPSLNKNIKELKKAKGKALIIAVDTAIKPLLNAGIVPDMFFIVDALKPVELVEIEGADTIPLVTTLNAAPEVLDYHKGKKFFYDEYYRFAEKIISKSGLRWGDVATGGSVATNAFSLLYKIGLKTIILVGQDLALTGNKSHADGTFQEKMPEIETTDCQWVEGNYEEKVPTQTDLYSFLNWYVETIREFKEHVKDFRVINATEGGARIDGTEVMTLKEAIAQTCTKEVDIAACLDTLSPMLKEEDRVWAIDYLTGIPEQFESLKKKTEKLHKSYCSLERLCKKQKMDSKQYLTLLKTIKKQITTIENDDMYQLVTMTMPSALKIMRDEEFEHLNTLQEEGKEIARKGKLYTNLVTEGAGLLKTESEQIFSGLKEKAN